MHITFCWVGCASVASSSSCCSQSGTKACLSIANWTHAQAQYSMYITVMRTNYADCLFRAHPAPWHARYRYRVPVPRPHPQMGKGLVTFERFLGCTVSAERTRLHTVQYVLCHMRAVWLSHDCWHSTTKKTLECHQTLSHLWVGSGNETRYRAVRFAVADTYQRRLDTFSKSCDYVWGRGAVHGACAYMGVIRFPCGDLYINIDVGRVCSLIPTEPPRLAHHSKALTGLIPNI